MTKRLRNEDNVSEGYVLMSSFKEVLFGERKKEKCVRRRNKE